MKITKLESSVEFFASSLQMEFIFILILLFTPTTVSQVRDFISIDCGGTSNYTDPKTKLEWISDTQIMTHGKSIESQNENENKNYSPQYQKRRDFPIDKNKYCYTLSTEQRRRYLVRATFLYGILGNENTYPKFDIYLDATKWATVTVRDGYRVYVEEMILRAPSHSITICLCCAFTGSPFISTLELRPLNLSMYATDFEDDFYLKVAARVNFGALSTDIIRYPDDPYDRIWNSDLEKRPNYLVDIAPGTKRINTTKNININTREYPPIKVMQTAVVGTQGVLSYRLNLEDFPANARAYAYFAEIEDLQTNESRKFKMVRPYMLDYSNAVVNIAENANGSYTLYEPSYMNVTLDFVFSFSFAKTPDSDRGPLLNAIEISKYVGITPKTNEQDVNVLNAFALVSVDNVSTNEGDPCVPTTWEWVACSSTVPPRITKILLSGKNVQGEIPSSLGKMDGLTELWLDGNSFTGPIPDISNLVNLKIAHLENNKLSGTIPSSVGSLPSLRELYIQNNSLSGDIPPGLLTRNVTINYKGNHGLRQKPNHKTNFILILGVSIGVFAVLCLLLFVSLFLLCNLRTKASYQNFDDKGDSMRISTKPSSTYSIARGGHLMDEGVAIFIPLPEIEKATNKFSNKIGKGSFGHVYYGKMKGGKEVAVKIMADPTSHGTKQFVTEVALLSRIHHRNLVPLIGYCEEAHHRMLVYEYMHNGTLRDHIHGTAANSKALDWLARLSIAEDAAKGLEYLHTGCNPSIIHRDVKTSNILLDIHMRAKVSDFGLSRQNIEDLTHISSMARGTVGYLDPEYYGNQQLTEKSDVYSFGIVLLELISGRKPVTKDYGDEWNIVFWARSLVRKGDAISIVDPSIVENLKVESVWRVAEVAVQCVQQHGVSRPSMQEIILAIQDAKRIQKGDQKISSDSSSKGQSARKTLLTSFLEIESPDISNGSLYPSAR